MRTQTTNPPITPVLRLVTLLEVLVLAGAGSLLFFWPGLARTLWPWQLTPFDTAFLGAVYLASFATVGMLLLVGRLAPARLVVPMILIFTIIVLVVSLASLDRFDFTRWGTWLWFILYIALPINAAVHVWLYRRMPPANPTAAAIRWRAFLLAEVLILGVYGLGLLLAPAPFTAFWPWPIDAFHSRIYSVVFITPALGAFLLARAAAAVEWLALGIYHVVLGCFALAGLAILDASLHKIAWSLPGTWVWLGLFALLALVGLGMIWQAGVVNRAGYQDRYTGG